MRKGEQNPNVMITVDELRFGIDGMGGLSKLQA